MRALGLVVAVGCSSSPPPISHAPPPVANAVVRPPGGKVTLTTGWGRSRTQELLFVDDGRRLVAADAGYIVEIDPIARAQLGVASLSSPSVPDPNGRPGVGETLSWTVDDAMWGWDAKSGTLLGAVSLSAWGDATRGPAVWRPEDKPMPIPPDSATACSPVALSVDHDVVAMRMAAGSAGDCHGRTTAIQLFSLSTRSAVSAPVEVGFANVAAFSSDGRYLAVGGDVVHLYDVKTRELASARPAHPVYAIAFQPKQPVVVWTTSDAELESWRVGDSAAVHRGKGTGVAFSPDGHYLATVHDHPVLLDASTFHHLGIELDGLRAATADAIAFSADSRQLAIAMAGDIGVWQLEAVPARPAADDSWFARMRPLPVPPPKPFPRIGRDGELDGRVLVGGKPVANAEITLSPHAQEYADARALPPITVHTSRDGSYHFANVPTIIWEQLVVARGATIGGYVFDMRQKKVHHADVKLDPAVTIVGTVLGPDKRRANNVRIFHPGGYADREVDVPTEPDGAFVIDHLRPGVDPTGGPGHYSLTARRGDGAVAAALVDISKPGPARVTLTLRPVGDPRVLRVSVVDPAGSPVAGALVSVESWWNKTDAAGQTSLDIDTSVTGPKGLRARVNKADGWARSDEVSVDLPRADPVVLHVER